MKNNENTYELIKLSRYKRLIKCYEDSEKILKDILKVYSDNISVYINLGELYFEMGKNELGIKCFLSVMHLLIKDKILKREGKLEYPRVERLRDENFIKQLSDDIKFMLPIKESFLVYKDENLSRCIGEVFSNVYDSEEYKIKVGREVFMNRISWNNILQYDVEKIYF